MKSLVVLEKLHVSSTTFQAICKQISVHQIVLVHYKRLTLELDFVLNDKRVVLVINCLWELCRDGMMGSLVLDDQSLVAFHTL